MSYLLAILFLLHVVVNVVQCASPLLPSRMTTAAAENVESVTVHGLLKCLSVSLKMVLGINVVRLGFTKLDDEELRLEIVVTKLMDSICRKKILASLCEHLLLRLCIGPPAEYKAFGRCNRVCRHCHAIFWDEENLSTSAGSTGPLYHRCCLQRRVKLFVPREYPPLIQQLFSDNKNVMRYDEIWMPMMSDLTGESSKPPMILPPLDIEWVWFCHTLNPVSYKEYCDSRFSKTIGKPAIFNQENKEYAVERCREIWISRYPTESFENESDSDDIHKGDVVGTDYLLGEVSKHRYLFTKFSKPYMQELVYLIAAKKRYKGFLFMLQRFTDSRSAFVPTLDILLMWITHKSYPTAYAIDMKEMEGSIGKVVESGESVKEEDLEGMKKLWESVFDQPYEKAGCPIIGGSDGVKPLIHWEFTDSDVNVKYRQLLPRFLLEVNILVKQTPMMKTLQADLSKEFLRFQLLRCHRDFKINIPINTIPSNSWHKVVPLYCEFGTKGIVVELRRPKAGVCIKGSNLVESKTFMWNELLRAPSITLEGVIGKKSRVVVSITPPAQAPYLLKSVPDRVTDDSGAMVSEVILKMNQYRPQEGRWLSRTVLDHAGRECFVIRMRMGGGLWRRGSNKPTVVKWEDRIIEIRAGSWSYIAGSIGKSPEKVIGTATPKTPSQEWRSSWCFSTGHELNIASDMRFDLKTSTSTDSQIRLLKGRHMQYQNKDKEEAEQDEEGFVTIIRFTEENPSGRATGLINWKLSAVEFLPEEDAVFVLLLSMTILRSVTEMSKEDVGSLLIRRRLKEANLGARDWGSVMVFDDSLLRSVYVKPWYWNANSVMAREGPDYVTKSYSAEECGDEFYKQALFG